MSEIDQAIDEYLHANGGQVDDLVRTELRAAIGAAVLIVDVSLLDSLLNPPSDYIHMIVARPSGEKAVSIKLGNLAVDPVKSIAAASGMTLAAANVAVPAAITFPALGIPALAIIGILSAAHLARKTDVKYEDACLLHAAWSVSADKGEWWEFLPADLERTSDLYISHYKVARPNGADAERSLKRLCSLGAIRAVADGRYQLLEEIRLI